MIVIAPSFEILDEINSEKIMKKLELAGRTCYKSEALCTDTSATTFIQNILKRGHESVIEHEKITVRIICDRGITHEIVRHRVASYSQESTRYCNYTKDKFGNEITVIRPYFWDCESDKYKEWLKAMEACEKSYINLIDLGATAQEARSVLPNSLKTEIVVTMNLREWRHFFKLRISEASHPQMLEITRPMLDTFKELLPYIFSDIEYN